MGSSGEPARILVVDDHPGFLAQACRFLEAKLGCRAQGVEDGEAAVGLVRAAPPDLVLLDVLMPGLDGFEVCRRLRPAYPGPILMLTGAPSPEVQRLGLEAGADAFLPKTAELDVRAAGSSAPGGGTPSAGG